MFTYKISYLLNGEKKSIVTDSTKDIKFAVRKRAELGPGSVFHLIYKHDKEEILDNVLTNISDELYQPNISEISISFVNTTTQAEDVIFTTNNVKVELDTELKPEDVPDNESDLPFETTLRIG